MTQIQIASDSLPAWGAQLGAAVGGLMTRSAAMGVLIGPAVTQLDARSVGRLVKALQRHGIGGDAAVSLAPLMHEPQVNLNVAQQLSVTRGLERLSEALEDCATPSAEWPAMRAVFGDDLLGEILAVSPASLRRYASAERNTPQETAEKLHWLALVVADLAGAYNDFGMRRWFDRPRSQLAGKSPRQRLGRQWSVDSDAARQVRALASVLNGAQPLAA
jgi:hypothetical protein